MHTAYVSMKVHLLPSLWKKDSYLMLLDCEGADLLLAWADSTSSMVFDHVQGRLAIKQGLLKPYSIP